MSFNFWSLDYIYYPVSGIMWVWHKVFGSFLGQSSALTWVLAVVFLVFTLRAILFKPFMKQMDSSLKMQAVQPEMKKIREKYKDDRQRLAEEMMKFNKEAGVNPLASCLPALIQAPVFIGLFHVLRMFQPVFENGVWLYRDSVYFFPREDVLSFAAAKLPGGAPLVGYMTMDASQLAFMGGLRDAIIWWGIPLTILAGIATHLTSRRSVARQATMNIDAAGNPQTAIMNKVMLYVFPIFVVVGGPFFPLAILFYWLANNSWTFGQLWLAHRLQDRRKAAEPVVVEEAKQAIKYSTPKPGARPKGGRPVVEPSKIAPDGAATDGPANGVARNGSSSQPSTTGNGAPKRPSPAGTNAPASGGSSPMTGSASISDNFLPPGTISDASKPKPGARSQRPNQGGSRKKKKSGRR